MGKTTPEKPISAICTDCDEEWTLLYAPMPLAKAARIMRQRAACPKCGRQATLKSARVQVDERP